MEGRVGRRYAGACDMTHAPDVQPGQGSARPDRPGEAWPLRLFRLAMGWLWAMLLALTGMGIALHRQDLLTTLPDLKHGQAITLTAAAFCLAGAMFIFMLLVADDLCPQAPTWMVAFLKTACATAVWISFAGLAWMILPLCLT